MNHLIPDHLLSSLSEFVSHRLGLHFPKARRRDLERGIASAAREFGFKDATACAQWLTTSQLTRAETEILASHLTIGETYFFREKGSFEALETRILPELIGSRRGKEQRLRIWSAGCSTGEEPYSLAILLTRMIPDIANWNVTILATDINPLSLDKGTRGVYREWSFRGVPAWMKEKYFSHSDAGRLEVPYAIRKMVTFANLNLAEDQFPSLVNNTNAMDVIFCRNVLMYFEPEQAARVIRGFRASLLDGGWLSVSPCEASPLFSAQFTSVSFPDALFYRKGDREERPRPFSCPVPVEATKTRQPAEPQAVFTPAPPEPPEPAPVKTQEAPQQPHAYEEALELHRQGLHAAAAERLCGFFSTKEAEEEHSPHVGKTAALLARVFADLGNLPEALRWSEKAIAADKLNAELHYLRATVFQEDGEVNEATASLRRAIYLDPAFVLSHFALGNLTQRQGKKKEAERHFANALSLLRGYQDGDAVPGGEGMTAGRLAEIIGTTRAGCLKR